MKFKKNQKVLIRKKVKSLRGKGVSLDEWLNENCFKADVLDVHENAISILKIRTVSIYAEDVDEEIQIMTINFDEYDVQPVRVEPLYQTDPMAITMY